MLFNSWQYMVFLPLVVLVYFLLPQKLRWAWLLAASYYFYMSWNVNLVVLILTTTFTSWGASHLIKRAQSKKLKKLWLFLAAAVSLGLLFFFKYFDFLSESVAQVVSLVGLPADPFLLHLMLPVGISFYTFQTLGYVIDVYRGTIPAEKHFGIYALFVSFFPQLVAGPIERAKNLLPQFREVHTPKAENFSWGLRYICWGLFKKAVVADTLARYVDTVYSNVGAYSPMARVIATVMFAVQIFCDFSGYSDIARGSAAILGFRLMENFKAPYFARSIREFWRRWHISLSTWFMDYVYIPLGGSRVKKWRHIVNLVITFVLSGMWHGAKWTFLVWGFYHGVLMAAETLLRGPREKLQNKAAGKRPLKVLLAAGETLVTFILVCAGWVFFRANDIMDALRILWRTPQAFLHPIANFLAAVAAMGLGADILLRLGLGILLLLVFDGILYYANKDPFSLLSRQKAPLRVAVSYGLALVLLAGLLSIPEGTAMEFIYFQF